MFEDGEGGDGCECDSGEVQAENEQCCSTVVDELEKKYLCGEDVDAGILLYSMTGTSPCKLASERSLRLLVLNHKRINRVGDEARLTSMGENVTEADFAWNSLSEWNEVSTLLRLPNLRVFNLSHNPLKDEIKTNLPISPFLQTLIMNDTNLPLATMRVFLKCAPALAELHLSENRLIEENLDATEEPLSLSVETLHVNRCEIKRWETVILLRQLLPRCSSMFVSENPIKTAFAEAKARNGRAMNGISQLNLNKCMVDEWKSVEALAEITTLRDLRISHNPLLANLSDEEKIHLVVARMPLLEVLNGSPISEEQREKSERFFIRYYDLCEVKPQIFPVLVARHGKLEQLCKVDLTPRKHASVTAFCEETGFRANVKVHLDHSVCSLMRTLEKHTGIPVPRMRLFLISAGSAFTEELRFPNQKLSSLRIEDGDQFLIQIFEVYFTTLTCVTFPRISRLKGKPYDIDLRRALYLKNQFNYMLATSVDECGGNPSPLMAYAGGGATRVGRSVVTSFMASKDVEMATK